MDIVLGNLIILGPVAAFLLILFLVARKLSKRQKKTDWTKALSFNSEYFLELIRNPRGKIKP